MFRELCDNGTLYNVFMNNIYTVPLVQMEITIVHFYLPVIRGVRFLKCLLAYNHTACDVS